MILNKETLDACKELGLTLGDDISYELDGYISQINYTSLNKSTLSKEGYKGCLVTPNTSNNDGIYNLFNDPEKGFLLQVVIPNKVNRTYLFDQQLDLLRTAVGQLDNNNLEPFDLVRLFSNIINQGVLSPIGKKVFPGDAPLDKHMRHTFKASYLYGFLSHVFNYTNADDAVQLYEEMVNIEPYLVKDIVVEKYKMNEANEEEIAKQYINKVREEMN